MHESREAEFNTASLRAVFGPRLVSHGMGKLGNMEAGFPGGAGGGACQGGPLVVGPMRGQHWYNRVPESLQEQLVLPIRNEPDSRP